MRLLPTVAFLAACATPGSDDDKAAGAGDTGCDAPAVWYTDADADGHGDPGAALAACAQPEGAVENADDCDDTSADVSPDVREVCDGIDNDCDGDVDDEDGSLDLATASPFYLDSDDDGFGDPAALVQACEAPAGAVADNTDCQDGDADTHPGAAPEDDEAGCLTDADGDGFGDTDPAAGVRPGSDCVDTDAAIHPDAAEVCDELDNDCDGDVDDQDADVNVSDGATYYEDDDGDGYGNPTASREACAAPSGFVGDGTDCDDARGDVNPGEDEVCDALDTDEDCSGAADDDDSGVDLSTHSTWYADSDGDGYGDPDASLAACDLPGGHVADATDCDDGDAAIHPGATEVCDASDTDEDCDGLADDADASVDSSGQTMFYADDDTDGYGDEDAAGTLYCDPPAGVVADHTDCDDADASSFPGGTETCDGADNDCDGTTDEDDATDVATWYADADSDTYGDPSVTDLDCTQPSGFVADNTDCDDGDGSIHPGAAELCDGTDNDCDGTTDEDDASDAATWYADADSDTYGDPSVTDIACAQPAGYVADNTDCDDADASSFPGGTETCDGADNDCDGTTDEDDATDVATWYADADSDTYGDPSVTDIDCTQPSGFVADNTDCDDTDSSVHPGEAEQCDAIDHDCDGDVHNGVLGAGASCPAEDCLAVLDDWSAAPDGVYTIDPTGTSAYDAYCDMTLADGGWTLVAIVANDGVTTWTYSNRSYWTTDTTLVGSVTDLTSDYKSAALQEVPFSDLMFLHSGTPTDGEVWAQYDAVGDDTDSLGTFIDAFNTIEDWTGGGSGAAAGGYPLTDHSGEMQTSTGSSLPHLCDTALYFNARDWDGGTDSTYYSCVDHAFGPVWNVEDNNGCPFDDPGDRSGLGPTADAPSVERTVMGFGLALEINQGSGDTVHVYVR